MERKRVVLADDVELFLMLEKTFFNREEFELITAHNGREALEAIREYNPDLVFLDLHMPEMNGDECCRLVKADERSCRTPVIMVTTVGNEEELAKCRSAGCDEILNKPVNRHDFLATARRFLKVTERETERFSARLRVHYGARQHELLSDYSIDLSTGGLFLSTNRPLPVETPLSIEFILPPSEKAIRCRARVAWVNDPEKRKKSGLPGGMGVQFLDLTLSDMDAIREYIRHANLKPG